MSTIDDLENKVSRLRGQLVAAEEALREAKFTASPINVGDRYRNRKGQEAAVTSLSVRYGVIVGVLSLINKDGKVGARTAHTNDWKDWKKCS